MAPKTASRDMREHEHCYQIVDKFRNIPSPASSAKDCTMHHAKSREPFESEKYRSKSEANFKNRLIVWDGVLSGQANLELYSCRRELVLERHRTKGMNEFYLNFFVDVEPQGLRRRIILLGMEFSFEIATRKGRGQFISGDDFERGVCVSQVCLKAGSLRRPREDFIIDPFSLVILDVNAFFGGPKQQILIFPILLVESSEFTGAGCSLISYFPKFGTYIVTRTSSTG
ncbi:hypothetical protein B0H12DRAFT_1071755 [Mycena haematopus]|nr:hypothetical protein B0H12DRAFT_1071755 [Mycena haematopus]